MMPLPVIYAKNLLPEASARNCEAKVQVREKETRAPKVHKTAQSEKIDKRRKLLVLGGLVELGCCPFFSFALTANSVTLGCGKECYDNLLVYYKYALNSTYIHIITTTTISDFSITSQIT